MLKFKIKSSDCVSKKVYMDITNITNDDRLLTLTSPNAKTMSDGAYIFMERRNGEEIIFKSSEVINKIDDTVFTISSPLSDFLPVEDCILIDGITDPFTKEEIKVLEIHVDKVSKMTNRNIKITENYTENDNSDDNIRRCSGDYVLYHNIFLLKSESVENNIYTGFKKEFLNTKINFTISTDEGEYELEGLLGVDYLGNDDNNVIYWIYDEYQDILGDFILENYNNAFISCRDEKFFITNYDTGEITLSKDMDGIIDTHIYFISNDIEINIPLSNNFNPSLIQSENIKNFYVKEQIDRNVTDIVDMEKQIFIPTVKKIGHNSEEKLNGVVDSIVINTNFRERENKSWSDGEVLNKYYNKVKYSTSLYDLGFTEDDIKYQKSSLKKSFLRLSFYDTKSRGTQSLLFYNTIFLDSNEILSKYMTNKNDVECSFTVSNNYNFNKSSEGYFLYIFPSLCKGESETTIYMKAEFNHAKYGKTIPLLLPSDENFKCGYISSNTDNSSHGINKLFDDLYIEVKIKYDKENNKYIWYFNKDEVNDYTNKKIILTLFEPIVNKVENENC